MKKQLLLFVLMVIPLVASADAVEINGIYYILQPDNVAEVTQHPQTAYSGNLVIPEFVIYADVQYNVTSIGNKAFRNTSVTSVVIPNSVTTIGNNAFQNCQNLTTITIPNSVTILKKNAFSGSSNLKTVSLGDGLTTIETSAFKGCSALTSITIGKGLQNVGFDAFSDCENIKSVYISDLSSWCKIDFAGSDANPLNVRLIPNPVRLYVNNVYVSDIVIPSDVRSIGYYAFAGYGMTSLTIPSSVELIKEGAFSSCGLTSLKIPYGVKTIGTYAFSFCYNLSSVSIPNSVTSIEAHAFAGCYKLQSISIPNSISSINAGTFRQCYELTSVEVGSGVKDINRDAFSECSKLSDFYCLANGVPNVSNDAFETTNINNVILHVPYIYLDKYKEAETWNSFKSIVAIEGTTSGLPKCEKPVISYQNGELKMNCATENVEYVTEITNNDINKHFDATIPLSATYHISVYAFKEGYAFSEVATATLCWIDQQPKTEGITDGIVNVTAKAVLIKSNGGMLTVEGVDDGETIDVYTINGVNRGSVVSQNGMASIDSNIQSGNVAIVKIGKKSIKVIVK